jgi:hypothetical protein
LAVTVAARSFSSALIHGLPTARLYGLEIGDSYEHLYLTDGYRGELSWSGHKIEFRPAKPSFIAAAGSEAGKIVQAIYWMGPQYFRASPRALTSLRFPKHITDDLAVLQHSLPRWGRKTLSALTDND